MIQRFLFIAYLAMCLPITMVYAEAPVVDETENFALLDEQQAAGPSVTPDSEEFAYNDNQPALAKEEVSNTRQDLDLINKIHGLQQEIQELRGQLEVQAHDLKVLQEQQLAFYKDLDSRLAHSPNTAIKKNNPPVIAIDPEAPTASRSSAIQNHAPRQPQPAISLAHPQGTLTRNNPAEEQISYLAAYDLVKNKHYENAISAMQAFIRKYPQGGYTANAHYWLGELYLIKLDYASAQEQFEVVIMQFPSSSKYSASLLKIGYALAGSGKTKEAKLKLQEVMKKYPDTQTAQLAGAKIASLGG